MTAYLLSLILIVLYATVISKPTWVPENTSWGKVKQVSAVGSMIYVSLLYFTFHDIPLVYQVSTYFTGVALSFITFQSIHSDFSYRRVDRRLFYLAYPIPLISNFLILKDSDAKLTIWFIALLLGLVFVFLPKLMGASDGRAFFFLALGVYPLIGLDAMKSVFLLMLTFVLLYSIIVSAREKNIKGLLKTKHIPAVPFILAPAVIILPLIDISRISLF